jgi:predicted dehydrogenase
MTEGRIGVGIIGANPERGWALRGHIPALRALPEFELAAVATSNPDSARLAAARFGARHATAEPRVLATHPDVDLVVITVQVAAHADLVAEALAAGKHVYCEWPLARTAGEAAALAAGARSAGVLTAVGLQARYAPAIRRARELIAAGELGRVTSVTVYAARGKGAAREVPGWTAYTYDRAGGAGLLEVYGGHVLDAVEFLLGPVGELSALLSVQRPEHVIAETGRVLEVTAPDHLLLTATLAGGAVASVHLHDGKVVESTARIEITGTEGDLAITAAGSADPLGGQLQISPLRLAVARAGTGWRQVEPPAETVTGETVTDETVTDETVTDETVTDETVHAPARNVAALYRQLAADLRTGRPRVPNFADGLRLHRLLDTIRDSAGTGTRRTVGEMCPAPVPNG